MKRIIGIILSLAMIMSYTVAVNAGEYDVTADEVREYMEKGTLLARQRYCSDVLDIEVYDMENLLAEPAPLGTYINPEHAFVYDVRYYDKGAVKSAVIEAWDDNGRVRTAYIGTDNEISSYLNTYEKSIHIAFDSYNNADKIADKINEADITDIMSITFNGIVGPQIYAGKDIYVIYNGEIMTTGEYFKNKLSYRKTIDERENELYEQKRALTPPEILEKFDCVNEGFGYEKTRSLEPYKDCEAVFSDLGDDEFLIQSSALLYDRGIISGFEDGTYHPDSILTRAEAAVILSKLVKGDYSGGEDFADIKNHWSRGAVNYLTAAGVIHGYEDGLFHPDDTLTFEHISIMLYEILGYCANEVDDMNNSGEGGYIHTLMNDGLYDGIDSFTGEKEITRSDFAKIITNALDMFLNTLYAPVDGKTEPHFYAVGSGRTLADYIDGKDVNIGEFCVSKEAYEKWKSDYTNWFYEAYKDIV